MLKLAIIGSDSFIAGKFINSIYENETLNLFSRQSSGKPNELIKADLMQITSNDFKGTDVVINFAAIVHQPNLKDEMLYKKVNTKLPIHLAVEAKKAGVKHFIQMSTIAVYGETAFIDENSPENPNTFYGKSKLAADKALLSLQDRNLKVSIIRPPMVYGGGNAPGNMFRLISLAAKKFPLPFKNIDNKRDFLNVHNLMQYLHIIIEKKMDGIFLISDNEPVSVEYIINIINKYLKKNSHLIKIPTFILKLLKVIRPNEYNKLFGSLTISTNFPFENLIKRSTVEEGIAEMVEYYKLN